MTGRFSRRVLEVRGVSLAALKNHPPVDEIEKSSSTPTPALPRLHSYTRSESQSSFTDGSSLSSLDEDEFDRESNHFIQQMFDDIDSVLYENENPSSCKEQMIDECGLWKTHHPQYRILGKQILPETELGFETLSTDDQNIPSNYINEETELTGGDELLVVRGKQMELNAPTIYNFCSSFDQTNDLRTSISEEVIASDGHYEELIANDVESRTPEFEAFGSSNLWLGESSTSRYVVEKVSNTLSHKLWKDVIRWLQPTLKNYVVHLRNKDSPVNHPLGPIGKMTTSNLTNYRLATAPPRSNLPADIEGILTVSAKNLQARAEKTSFSVPATALHSSNSPMLRHTNDVLLASTQSFAPVRRLQAAMRLMPLERTTRCSADVNVLPVTSRQSVHSGRPLTLPPIQNFELTRGQSHGKLSKLSRPSTLASNTQQSHWNKREVHSKSEHRLGKKTSKEVLNKNVDGTVELSTLHLHKL